MRPWASGFPIRYSGGLLHCPQQSRRSALQLINQNADFWPTAAKDMGLTLAALADRSFPQFGTRVGNNRFLPVRGTWKVEWKQIVHAIASSTAAMGLDFGPLSRRALERIETLLPSLEAVQSYHLVHGDLTLPHLEYSKTDSQRVRVCGFDDAMIGDHLVEFDFSLKSNLRISDRYWLLTDPNVFELGYRRMR